MNNYIFGSILIIGVIVVGLGSWILSGQSLPAPVNTITEGNLEENSNIILETSATESVSEDISVPQEGSGAEIVLNNSTNTTAPQDVPAVIPVKPVSNQASSPVSSMVLPPRPDPSLVDATLKGVDANNNGIRDEAEHYIAENTTGKEVQALALEYARFLSKMSSYELTGTKEDAEAAGLLITSFDINKLDAIDGHNRESIYNLVLNTPEREDRYYTLIGFLFNPDSAIQAKECSLPTTVFGVRMPPEPNKTENDATLLGIDTNNNKVRDDVERLIACNVKSHNDFAASMDGARQYQRMLELPEKPLPREVLLDIYSELLCAELRIKDSDIDGAWSLERDLGRATFNTEMRQLELREKKSDFGGYFGSELKECLVVI